MIGVSTTVITASHSDETDQKNKTKKKAKNRSPDYNFLHRCENNTMMMFKGPNLDVKVAI